ncbi:cytochrome P450-12 [Coleophoma crateriformis]|uniref:Cytochrome P450-12 n=1 Tax=Coleophoma crateriformis TaxID=565419 RepID=A0A3D8S240_9HELO|nr:cytochrome P450-12 [Coleophoma crateriformis]
MAASQIAAGESLVSKFTSGNVLILCGVIGGLYLLDFLLTPRLDASEPPLLKPSIPLIGHIIGIIWHQTDYHRIVHKKHPIPIASLQMLWGKIYTVWDPQLAQASLRTRNLSFGPFVVEFAQKAFGLSAETFAKITDNKDLVPDFTEAIHAGMQPKCLHAMNATALNHISRTLDKVSPDDEGGVAVPNLYLWVRDAITFATAHSLLGKENPFENNPSLVEDLWTFEGSLPHLLTKPFPTITVRKGYLARNKLQAVLGKYYTAMHDVNDPTVAQLTRGRANVLRGYGFSGVEVAQAEVMLPVAATTNSVPTMYWLICSLFAKPALVDRIREEVLPLLEKGGDSDPDVVTINISRLERECPLLVSCYREIMRLFNQNVSMRRILADTTINDGKGNSYLLKKGVDVQIASGIVHRMQGIWGDDVLEFNPERFLPPTGKSAGQVEKEKTKKNAYIPFGGGQHLCPGRNFALAEILAISSALVVGFDLTPIGMDFDQMKAQPAVLANAVAKPANDGEGLGIKLRRRKGWEAAEWRFEG